MNGDLSESNQRQLQLHALELRHLQQLAILDLSGADCFKKNSG